MTHGGESERAEPCPERMRICVLGGGGFLGSHLVETLLRETDHAIEVIDTGLDRLPASGSRLRTLQASIADPGVIARAVADNQVLVSMTALCNPSLYNTEPLAVIDENFTHLTPLVELATRHRRRLVHFSTCEVYGHTPRGDGGQATAMNEDHTPLELGPVQRERWTYACAKQLLERLIWAQGRHHGLNFTLIRPFNVIGPRMDYLPGVDGEGIPRVLACFMRSLLFGEPLALVNGGQARRSFVSVQDFSRAVLRILERPALCQGEIFNIGNPRNDVSMAELAETMRAVFLQLRPQARTHPPRVVTGEDFYGPGYDDVEQRIPDIGKAQRLLQWQPETSLAQMLPEIVADYIARYADQVQLLTGSKRS